MRIRQTKHQRRMMCLLLICTWSLASMIVLWRKIFKEDVTTSSIKNALNKSQFFEVPWEEKKTVKRPYHPKNIKKLDDESLSGNFIEPTAKLRTRKKPRVDYGRNRDLDVEGVHDYIMWYENFQNIDPQLPTLPRQQKCKKPLQNIAFIKTHFTGSDVITNILNRYGDLNNLNVALPSDGLSTFYWPMRFQWKYIDITLLNGSLPNIISNHARYNNDVMDNILNPGSVYITILRDPVTQLETTFNNLGFGGLLQVTNTSDQLYKFLEDPKYYIRGVIRRKRFKDTLNLIKNAQFFDLGLPTTEYHRRNIIKATIQELYEKFTVVLIYEYLDESLLLMKRKFCWQLDDILYLKFHYTSNNIWNRQNSSEELRNKIHHWNEADYALYRFFNKTLWEEIKYEGDSFWKELKSFKQKLKEMNSDCLGSKKDNHNNEYLPNLYDDRFNLDDIPSEKPMSTTNSPTQYTTLTKNYKQNFLAKKSKFENKTLKDILVYTNVIRNTSLNFSDSDDFSANDRSTSAESNYQTQNNNSETITEDRYNELNKTLESRDNGEGSGGHFVSSNVKDVMRIKPFTMSYSSKISKSEKMLSDSASSWNYHFCKKLLMSECEYLDYFRRKHAYAKAAARKL